MTLLVVADAARHPALLPRCRGAAAAETIALAASLLVLGASFFVTDGAQTVAGGALRGLNDTRVPLLFSAVSFWVVGFATAYTLAFLARMEAVGIWTELGRIPNLSQIGLHADAALNAMRDAGIGPKDIDGIATAGETPVTMAHYLGITPEWVDGTAVGGCSFMSMSATPPRRSRGLCKTVLITHGESGRSGVARHARSWRRTACKASSSCRTGRSARRPCSRSRCCAT